MARLILVRNFKELADAENRAKKLNARGKATMIKFEKVEVVYMMISRLESYVRPCEWRHVLYIVE